MSNTFNQQLEQALKTVNTTLQQNELTQKNSLKGAKMALYYAHGITAKNSNQLKEDQAKNIASGKENQVASTGAMMCQNIITASNAALLDASNTTNSAAVAATAVQQAANALTNLSANVASVMAVASSLDKGSRIQRLVEKAGTATKTAAEMAEEASMVALDVTVEASQSRAAGVVSQAGAVKTNMAALLKSLTDTFGKQQDAINNDLATLNEAIATEHEQAGIYKTSEVEDNAMLSAESFINKHLNYNLRFQVEGNEGDQFVLRFAPFKEMEGEDLIISEYRIIIAKEDDAVAFNTDYAKAARSYVTLKAGSGPYSARYITPDYLPLHDQEKKEGYNIALDYLGAPVVRAVPYVFFVYAIYTNEYQNETNDTNGLLSLPSPGFTLKTVLPVVNVREDLSLSFYQKDGSDAVRVAFKIPRAGMKLKNGVDLNALMEFRVFIFNDSDRKALAVNEQIDQANDQLFLLEQDFRDKEERYLKAVQAYNTMLALGEVTAQEITLAKNEMDIAKAHFQSAKAAFLDQVSIVESLNKKKVSDFYVDEEILEEISPANYMLARKNNKLLLELQQNFDALTNTEKDLREQSEQYDNSILDLKNAIAKTEQDIKDLLQKDNPMQDDLKGWRKKLEQDIAQLESYQQEKIKIKTLHDALAYQQQVGNDKSEQATLIEAIIKDFEALSNVQAEESDLSTQLLSLRNELKQKANELVIAQSQQEIVKDELTRLPMTIKHTKNTVTWLSGKEDSEKDFDFYEVVNEAGDFVDNYGEALVNGAGYCAVVLSVIKDAEPEAQPLYQNQASGFSSPVNFNPTQL